MALETLGTNSGVPDPSKTLLGIGKEETGLVRVEDAQDFLSLNIQEAVSSTLSVTTAYEKPKVGLWVWQLEGHW